VLYYPEYDHKVTRSNLLELPLPVLHVAHALKEAGFPVEIEDGRVPGALKRLQAMETAPLFFGISCFLGQIDDGYKAAEQVRARFPDVPIVCGGWLPTTSPEVFRDNSLISILLRGPAEVSAPMLAKRIAAGEDLTDIPGILFPKAINGYPIPKQYGPMVAPSMDLPFELLDITRYELAEGRLDLQSSRGCPSRCTFCAMASIYQGHCVSMDADAMIESLLRLKEKYPLERINLYDDSFFLDHDRVMRFADGLLENDMNLLWMATGRIEDLVRFSEEEWKKLAATGCSIVSTGIESASPRIRRLLGKRFSNEEIYNVAEMLRNTGIRFSPFFIVDTPTETKEELEATFSMIMDIMEADPENAPYLSVYFYFPMPNTPLFEMEKKEGVLSRFPNSLEALCRVPHESHWSHAPWIPRAPFFAAYRNRRRVHIQSFYFWARNICPALIYSRQSRPLEMARRGLQVLLGMRIKNRFFHFPIEYAIYRSGWMVKRLCSRMTASDAWKREQVGVFPHQWSSSG